MKKLTLVDITKPTNGSKVYTDYYWQVIDDATQALFHGSTPQCNRHEKIAQTVGYAREAYEVGEHFDGEFKVIHVPVAYFIDNRGYITGA